MRRTNSSNILLKTDYCGGHECDDHLPGVRIETLPVNSKSKNQPLDFVLIAHSRIRLRSLLLRKVFDNTMRRSSSSHYFPENSGGGKNGLRDGYMPHVGDAMDLFNYCWS